MTIMVLAGTGPKFMLISALKLLPVSNAGIVLKKGAGGETFPDTGLTAQRQCAPGPPDGQPQQPPGDARGRSASCSDD